MPYRGPQYSAKYRCTSSGSDVRVRTCARYPGLRIPPLIQDHSNVLFPHFEPCSKRSGHLNNPLYNLR